jgi:hypothetical protein
MKKLLANLLLYSLAAVLLFPESAAEIAGFSLARAVPFIPLLLYVGLGLLMWDSLFKVPREDAQAQAFAGTYQAMSLTLTGFCFTSMGFLLAFFKEDLKGGTNLSPAPILRYFAIALGCFLTSYMVLRFRNRQLFFFLCAALLDNGLWCVVIGFLGLAVTMPTLHRLTGTFVVLAGVFLLYVGIHFIYSIRFSRL